MTLRLSALMTAAALTLGHMTLAHAVDVQGAKIEDTATVAGKTLVLNGAGARIKAVFKVYAVGLYLTEKKSTTPEVLALGGPKRFKIVALRELTSDEFGQAFLTGINKNLEKDEKSRYVNQLVKFGDLFTEFEGIKKGDVIIGDYNPANGTTIFLNGKQLGSPLPDVGFYNAILRIWIGANPADNLLKPMLLGDM
nr:chalcone isomerase family protein [uncultured Aquabacterium sp.]